MMSGSGKCSLLSNQHASCCRDGKLLLVPMDESHTMRPLTSHLDEPAAKPAAPKAKTEGNPYEMKKLEVCQFSRMYSDIQIAAGVCDCCIPRGQSLVPSSLHGIGVAPEKAAKSLYCVCRLRYWSQ